MGIATDLRSEPRWVCRLRGPDRLDEDLGTIGDVVGPRTGPSKRTHGDKEDYTLRRLLVALRDTGKLRFPISITAERERDGEPDFVLSFETGETLGIEVSEVGDERDQAFQTKIEKAARPGQAIPLSEDGIVDDVETEHVADQIVHVVDKKAEQYRKGKYLGPDACDLVVYDNTLWGEFLDKREIVESVRRKKDQSTLGFRAVHIVFGSHVAIDTLGTDPRLADISKRYEHDRVEWLFDQAERLRREKPSGIDAREIAEELETLGRRERRALSSHMHNRVVHMIKWIYQPERRSRSWYASLTASLSGMEDIIAVSPSLGTSKYLAGLLEDIYVKAREQALRETVLAPDSVPASCPFDTNRILDPRFAEVEPRED